MLKPYEDKPDGEAFHDGKYFHSIILILFSHDLTLIDF